jgi:hypothetical protein
VTAVPDAAVRARSDAASELLARLMSRRPDGGLEALDLRTRTSVQSAFLLLDPAPAGDVDRFVSTTLDRLLRMLKPRTERVKVEYQGRTRGRVVWPRTTKARMSEDCDPTRFVCSEVKRLYDTPENRLLKYVAVRLAGAVRSVPEAVRWGTCLYPAEGGFAGRPTAVRIARVESRLDAVLRDARLRGIELPREITREHLKCAESLRVDEYAALARFYARYRSIALAPTWPDAVADAATRVLPLADDPAWLDAAAAALRRACALAEPSGGAGGRL